MDVSNRDRAAVTLSALSLAVLIGTSIPALATDSTKPAPDKWRPKDGLYIRADREFTGPCEDVARFLFELSKNHFVVDERAACKITKIADTAPGAVRLNMICNESEIAGDDGKDYKETMTLRKISDTSFYMNITDKGKVNKQPPWRVNFCQRLPQEGDRAEAEQKKAAQNASWQPRDGVYASAGADFDDRCLKSGDAVVRLAQSALSMGGASCYVAHVSVEPPNSVTLNVNCGQGVVTSNGSILGSNSTESVTLSKIDDQSVLFHRSRDGRALWSDQQLRYCPEAAQRNFTESKTK